MDDVLKYQRIEGALQDIFKKEKVTAANLETDHIVLGTENGFLHIINFSGQVVKSARLHKRAINSISVDLDGDLAILSGADNGAAVLLTLSANDFKESTVSVNEAVKAVCLEPSANALRNSEQQNTLSKNGDRAFLVGTSSGRLILHRPAGWFRQSQKEVVLFPGAGSAITTIKWEGNLVAWADVAQVRVMDISTQTALCQMSAPMGVGAEEPYPCSLCWTSPRDLLIGWADNFRHVRISAAAAGVADTLNSGSSKNSTKGSTKSTAAEEGKVATVVAEWMTDSLISGLHGFDAEHVVYLAYTPPLDEEVQDEVDEEELLEAGSDNSHVTNQPELIVAKLSNGHIVSADQLPLKGCNFHGPEAYMLLSSHQCKKHRQDASKWQLRAYQAQRGGARGYAPVFFVGSPQDFVVARVRDVNDRVGFALSQRDLKRAVDIARVDRTALTLYNYTDILRIYLTHLLEQRDNSVSNSSNTSITSTAATECFRLIGSDGAMWEEYVYKFIEYKQLESIATLIPTDKPTLDTSVYEAVLTNLLADSPKVFLDIVKRWGRVKPVLFNHTNLLRTLEVQKTTADKSLAGSYFIEAQAQLYIFAHMYERAVNCYLDSRIGDRIASSNNNTSGVGNSVTSYKHDAEDNSSNNDAIAYRFVFDLIERQNLFKAVSNKVANLVRLSKPLAARLLLTNIDKLPIRSVAQQLSADRRMFLWYLHLLFTDPLAREIYSDELEYADLHARQVQLYAEFMPKNMLYGRHTRRGTSVGSVGSAVDADHNHHHNTGNSSDAVPEQVIPTRAITVDSDLLVFLKSGLAPLDLALLECEKQQPPLYREMIYILAHMGNQRKALHLHLTEIGDVGLAIEFIESQLDSYIGNKRRYGHKLSVASDHNNGTSSSSDATSLHTAHYVECQLWDDLIDYSLSHTSYLTKVLDYLGMCKLNPVSVLSRVPPNAQVPYLKLRLTRLLEHIKFQGALNQRSTALQEVDALNLLRQQNQGQRRAMKVESAVRCSACSRPLAMAPGTGVIKGGQLHMQLLEMTHSSSGAVQVWGPKPSLVDASASVSGSANGKNPSYASTAANSPTGAAASAQNNAFFADTNIGTTSAAAAATGSVSVSVPPTGAAGEEAAAKLALIESGNVSGTVIFSNKLAFHRLCYMRMHC